MLFFGSFFVQIIVMMKKTLAYLTSNLLKGSEENWLQISRTFLEYSEEKKFNISLEKDFIFQFRFYFPASSAFYCLVSSEIVLRGRIKV